MSEELREFIRQVIREELRIKATKSPYHRDTLIELHLGDEYLCHVSIDEGEEK